MTEQKYPTWWNFPISTVSGCLAWVFIHPADLIKVRMNVSAEKPGVLAVCKEIMAARGPTGFFDGISGGIARQVVYATLRLSLFDISKSYVHEYQKSDITSSQRLLLGMGTGGIAAFISTPVEVGLVRMQADGKLPVAERRNYASIFNAIGRIGKEEGIKGFYAGSTPTVARAMMVGMTQVGFYDVCKTWLQPFGLSTTVTNTSANLITGLVYSFTTMPVEVVKNTMMAQKPLPDGTMKYKGMLQTLATIPRERGIAALWQGYSPYYVRCAGHTFFMFSIVEQLKAFANKVHA